VLSSSTGDQSSYVRDDGTMSVFTYHLVEALTGHAQPQEGATEVLVSDVMSYVYRRVPQTVSHQGGGEQQPDYLVTGNFPIALLLGGQGLAKGQSAPDPMSVAPGRGGDTITLGNVTGSTFAVGQNATVVVHQGQGQERTADEHPLAQLARAVHALPDGMDKNIAQSALQELQAQAQRGSAAQEDAIGRALDYLAKGAPDAWRMATKALVQPTAGLGPAFQTAALRALKNREDRS
jgi:hypothetical protein